MLAREFLDSPNLGEARRRGRRLPFRCREVHARVQRGDRVRMLGNIRTWVLGVLLVVFSQVVLAQEEGPALPKSPLTMEQLVEGLSDGSVTLQSVRRRGLDMFTTS